MRNLLYVHLCVLAAILAGCGNRDKDAPAMLGKMTAKISGQDFSASQAIASKTTFSGRTTLSLSGLRDAGNSIIFSVTGYSGPREYRLGIVGTVSTAAIVTTGGNQYGFVAGRNGGTLTISKDEGGRLEGTFSFSASNPSNATVQVTEGVFEAVVQ